MTWPHERIVHTSNRVPAIPPSPQSMATPAALAEAGGSSRQAKKRTICHTTHSGEKLALRRPAMVGEPMFEAK